MPKNRNYAERKTVLAFQDKARMRMGCKEIDLMNHNMPIVDKEYEFVNATTSICKRKKKDLQAISMLYISFKCFERFPKRRFIGLFLQH